MEDFDIKEFDKFDPYEASRPSTILKLLSDSYEPCTDEYAAKRADGKKVPQWVMIFEDGLRPDFNNPNEPRIIEQRINLAYWRKKKDSDETELVKHGRNSTPVKYAKEIMDKAGVNLSPAAEGEQYVNGWFRATQYTYGEEPFQKRVWVTTEFLGFDEPEEVTEARARWNTNGKGEWV